TRDKFLIESPPPRRSSMRKLCIATLFVVFLTSALFAEQKDVTFTGSDGFTLKGTLFSSGKIGPGVLMLHQCNADRQLYAHLGNMLSEAGYSVLSFDFRGFGGSKAGEFTDFAKQGQKINATMPGDVDAALNFLGSQSTTNKVSIGIVAG